MRDGMTTTTEDGKYEVRLYDIDPCDKELVFSGWK
jgi:endonuclease YncB( thermonuclease family)